MYEPKVIDAWTDQLMDLPEEYQERYREHCRRVMTISRWYLDLGTQPTREQWEKELPGLDPAQWCCGNCGAEYPYPQPPIPPGKRTWLCRDPQCRVVFALNLEISTRAQQELLENEDHKWLTAITSWRDGQVGQWEFALAVPGEDPTP
jgi:hypothetical protein